MSVFPSKGSARRTNPESRCGRSPTVVRITRSHDARTGASAIGGRRGTDTLRRERVVVAHPPKPPRPKPATASPALSRKFRLFIAIVSDARQSGFSHTPAAAIADHDDPQLARSKGLDATPPDPRYFIVSAV